MIIEKEIINLYTNNEVVKKCDGRYSKTSENPSCKVLFLDNLIIDNGNLKSRLNKHLDEKNVTSIIKSNSNEAFYYNPVNLSMDNIKEISNLNTKVKIVEYAKSMTKKMLKPLYYYNFIPQDNVEDNTEDNIEETEDNEEEENEVEDANKNDYYVDELYDIINDVSNSENGIYYFSLFFNK